MFDVLIHAGRHSGAAEGGARNPGDWAQAIETSRVVKNAWVPGSRSARPGMTGAGVLQRPAR